MKFKTIYMLLAVAVCCCLPGLVSAQDGFETALLSRLQNNNEVVQVAGQPIYGAVFIGKLYQSNGYKPYWNASRAGQLREQIFALEEDGLNPADYWFPMLDDLLEQRRKGDVNLQAEADLELLLSEAFIRAYYNLAFGKADPERLDDDFNYSKPLDTGGLRAEIIEQLGNGEVTAAFDAARPDDRRYLWLRQGLSLYRGYLQAGGWSPISEGRTLKPGDQDSRVLQLRARLAVTGEYAGKLPGSDVYGAELEAAVKRFQQRHGLSPDGVVGARSIAAMNVPVAQRIDQIRVNLERQRWYLHENTGEFILVDIAGYNVYWIRDDQVYWSAKAQVGKEYTRTPMFKDMIRYLEFNPTWTIPRSIINRSVLPGLKKDPDYLTKKGYQLLTNDGKQVSPDSVDWANASSVPYIVRQPAGPDNALGRVKFMFPNKHAVYLHDTNHRENFATARRSFSSGCVRVDKPYELAEKLLAGQDDWNRSKIDDTVASGKTVRVNLAKPVRVIIAYSTAMPTREHVQFKEDLYGRDSKLLQALNGPFRVRTRDIK